MPLQSWYHSGFDKEPDLTNPEFLAGTLSFSSFTYSHVTNPHPDTVERAIPFEKKWGDFAQCLWPNVNQADFGDQ